MDQHVFFYFFFSFLWFDRGTTSLHTKLNIMT